MEMAADRGFSQVILRREYGLEFYQDLLHCFRPMPWPRIAWEPNSPSPPQ